MQQEGGRKQRWTEQRWMAERMYGLPVVSQYDSGADCNMARYDLSVFRLATDTNTT